MKSPQLNQTGFGRPLASSSFLQKDTDSSQFIVTPYVDTKAENELAESKFFKIGLVKDRISFWEEKQQSAKDDINAYKSIKGCGKIIKTNRKCVNWSESGIFFSSKSATAICDSRESLSSTGSSTSDAKSSSSGITSMSNPTSESGCEVNYSEEQLQNIKKDEAEPISEIVLKDERPAKQSMQLENDVKITNHEQKTDVKQKAEEEMVVKIVTDDNEASTFGSINDTEVMDDTSNSWLTLLRKTTVGCALEIVVSYLVIRSLSLMVASLFE